MVVGREYTLHGWARARGILGDYEALAAFLRSVCETVRMQPLELAALDVPFAVEALGRDPFEDEGGASAVLILSTSHMAIHGWPYRDNLRSDGAYFMFSIQSCRDFKPEAIRELAHDVLQTTAVSERDWEMVDPHES